MLDTIIGLIDRIFPGKPKKVAIVILATITIVVVGGWVVHARNAAEDRRQKQHAETQRKITTARDLIQQMEALGSQQALADLAFESLLSKYNRLAKLNGGELKCGQLQDLVNKTAAIWQRHEEIANQMGALLVKAEATGLGQSSGMPTTSTTTSVVPATRSTLPGYAVDNPCGIEVPIDG
jgi:hypothetical protein